MLGVAGKGGPPLFEAEATGGVLMGGCVPVYWLPVSSFLLDHQTDAVESMI